MAYALGIRIPYYSDPNVSYLGVTTDIIWRSSASGRVIIWYMDGITRTGTTAIWG